MNEAVSNKYLLLAALRWSSFVRRSEDFLYFRRAGQLIADCLAVLRQSKTQNRFCSYNCRRGRRPRVKFLYIMNGLTESCDVRWVLNYVNDDCALAEGVHDKTYWGNGSTDTKLFRRTRKLISVVTIFHRHSSSIRFHYWTVATALRRLPLVAVGWFSQLHRFGCLRATCAGPAMQLPLLCTSHDDIMER